MSKVLFLFLCFSIVSIAMARSVFQHSANDVDSPQRTQQYFINIRAPISDSIASEEAKEQYLREPIVSMPVIRHKNGGIRDKKQDHDEIQSFPLGTAAAIGAMLGAMKLGSKSNAEENFDEVMKIIASLQQPKAAKKINRIKLNEILKMGAKKFD